MGFTHIFFLLAGAAVIGPILAHLLNRARFRKVPFTMLRFLELSQKQTQSRRKLHDFLILLLRCMIILFIAMLFAGPVIYKRIQRTSSKDIHVLLLDNSISMSCETKSMTCFEQMHEEANDYLKGNQGPESVFHLYSTVSGCIGQDLTVEAAELLLKEQQVQPGATDLSAFFADLKQIVQKKGKNDTLHIHMISDFTDEFMQSFIAQGHREWIDGFSFDVIDKDLNAENMAVTNAQVLNLQGSQLTLSATVANWGNKAEKRLIRADLYKSTSDEVFVNPIPGQQQDVLITLDVSEYIDERKCFPIEIKLIPEDDLVADDFFPLGVSIRRDEKKNVLLLGNNPDELFLMYTATKTLKESKNSDIRSIDVKTFSAFNHNTLYAYDLVIASAIDSRLNKHADAFEQYLKSGGRCVFFVTGRMHAATCRLFYDRGILPALPKRNVHEVAHLEPLECHTLDVPQNNSKMLSVLEGYRIDKIPLWTYYTCQQKPEAVCMWGINPQTSLLYQMKAANGYSTLINTSIDDAYSGLTKNPAILPLIRYLMGFDEQVSDYSYACDETVLISLKEHGKHKEIDYVDAGDERHTIRLSEATSSHVRVPGPHHCGWMRMVTEPVQYIGIHPVVNETNLKRTPVSQINKKLELIFHNPGTERVEAKLTLSKEAMSLNRYLIGIIMFLIFIESYISNRMQRS